MRYRENRSVDDVLVWLKEQNCAVSARSYHDFMARVLHLMTLEHAKELGVEVDLLRAIRVRYKLSVDPKSARGLLGKPAPRHNSRSKRRKIGLPRKPKSAPPRTVVNIRRQTRVDSTQLPPPGIEASEAPKPAPRQIRGDVTKPETLRFGDWKIINEQAKAKLAKQTRHIFTNDHGTVFHLKTRKQYTAEDLVAEFGLTAVEARSCFLTLDN